MAGSSLKILHTADWHLGHTLHQQSRHEEHARFLDWMSDLIAAEQVDALLIAGDVFESANPPTKALRLYYETLMRLRADHPRLEVVVIGGNHDSAARLDAPGPLWESVGVRVVGGLPRDEDGAIDVDQLLFALHDASGAIAAWVMAVPFLRPSDLPRLDLKSTEDPMIAGVADIYATVIEAARARREPGQALIAMGHCYMADTKLSENSERKVLGGNQHALTHRIFPNDIDYVALGHLHLAQTVRGDHIRYSGSPIPLSMTEAGYDHQVALVEFEAGALRQIATPSVPRSVELLRLPEDGPKALLDLIVVLEALPDLAPDAPQWTRPFLEVSVVLEAPDPTLRERVEQALTNKAARLVSLKVIHDRDGGSLADLEPQADLGQLTPEAVFTLKWAREHPGEPTPEVMHAFSTLLDAVGRQES